MRILTQNSHGQTAGKLMPPAAEPPLPTGHPPQPAGGFPQTIGKLRLSIGEWTQCIDEKSQPIDKLPQPLDEKPQPIDKLPHPLDEKPQPIDKLPQPLDEKPQPIGKLPQSLDEKPQLIDKLPQPLDEKPQPIDKKLFFKWKNAPILDKTRQTGLKLPETGFNHGWTRMNTDGKWWKWPALRNRTPSPMPVDAPQQACLPLAGQFMLPDTEHLPAGLAQGAIDPFVPVPIAGNFGAPERRITLGLGGMTRATMPETAIHEYGEPHLGENEIRTDGESSEHGMRSAE